MEMEGSCSAFLTHMSDRQVKSLAKGLGLTITRSEKRQGICKLITREFSRKCEAAEAIPRKNIIKMINENLLNDTEYRVGPHTPRHILCSALALALNSKGKTCEDGRVLWKCLLLRELKLTETPTSHWLRRVAQAPVTLPYKGLSYLAGATSRATLGTGEGGHLKGYAGVPALLGRLRARVGRSIGGMSTPPAVRDVLEKRVGDYETSRSILSSDPTIRNKSIAPWENVKVEEKEPDYAPTFFDRRTLYNFNRFTKELKKRKGTVRVLTQNCHFRPHSDNRLMICNPESNFDDVQMKRACGLIDAIHRIQGTSNEPDIICFQEAFGERRQARIRMGLKRLYPYFEKGVKGSGALTFSRFPIMSHKFVPFDVASGVDLVPGISKGTLLTAHSVASDKALVVANIHPSAYVPLNFLSGYLDIANKNDVYETHLSQLKQIRDVSEKFIRDKFGGERIRKEKKIILVFAGDFNINRYASVPGGRKEMDTDTASQCCSFEYLQATYLLGAESPPLIPDTSPLSWYDREMKDTPVVRFTDTLNRFTIESHRPLSDRPFPGKLPVKVEGHGGVFSWDGSENTVALNPLWDKQFQLIDFILLSKKYDQPVFMDNRVVRLPISDVIPWINRSVTPGICRGKKNREMEENQIRKNRAMRLKWRTSKNKEGKQKVDLKLYGNNVRRTRHYPDDFLKGKSLISEEEFNKMNTCGFSYKDYTGLDIGERTKFHKDWDSGFFNLNFEPAGKVDKEWTLPYQLYNNVSDHYGVVSSIVFPDSEASEFFKDLRERGRVPPIPPIGSYTAYLPSSLDKVMNRRPPLKRTIRTRSTSLGRRRR